MTPAAVNPESTFNRAVDATRATLPGDRRSPPGFAGSLAAATARRDSAEAQPSQDQQARTAAERLVATSFIQPLLARMRESPFQTRMFHGGQGEKAFGQRLDRILAERMVKRSDFQITDAVQRFVTQSTNPTPGKQVNTHG